jgi:drug/metabolite transporter (DMT)-like permease
MTLLLIALTVILFAANSLLCRAALRATPLDPASFTAIRLATAALAAGCLVRWRRGRPAGAGSWGSALALFAYAVAFSFAYRTLPASMGALMLFLAVQATMTLWGLRRGERLGAGQTAGLLLALAGLVYLLRPGLAAPPLAGSALMLGAGVAWGIYSLRGMGGADPAAATAGNFLRTLPMAGALCLALAPGLRLDPAGCAYAALSGAIASGLGYILWYRVIQVLSATTAASTLLSVPALAALAGVTLLGEPVSLRLAVGSVSILGGIALVLRRRG